VQVSLIRKALPSLLATTVHQYLSSRPLVTRVCLKLVMMGQKEAGCVVQERLSGI